MTQVTPRRRGRRSWTEQEDAQVIASLRQQSKLQDVANELEDVLDRSWGAIMNRARILSQDLPDFQRAKTRRRWTSDDDLYLREHWENDGPEDIAAHLKRSVGAVKMRVSVLGFARKRRRSNIF